MQNNNQNKKSLFGAYSQIRDEGAHVLISLVVALIGYTFGLSAWASIIVFVSGAFLIDLDHYIDVYLCKKYLKVPNYKGVIGEGYGGYAPYALHGFDIALIVSIIVGSIGGALFGWMMFLSLSLHLLWDFAVYPYHHSHLTLAHRAKKGFRRGKRDYFLGRIFDTDTLKW